jgi:glycosyltransferase involved in cell wall biosynthesis
MAEQRAVENIVVAIATKGRAKLVADLANSLFDQTLKPRRVIIVASSEADIEHLPITNDQIIVRFGFDGLTRQRNIALSLLDHDDDVIVFFDDDFIPSRHWLCSTRDIFQTNTDLVGLTGRVLMDGINSVGLSPDKGSEIVAEEDQKAALRLLSDLPLRDCTPYGCNMAFRVEAVKDLRFDERLVLYGWQEDRDFGRRALQRGRVARSEMLWGVHLGVKGGRVSGLRLGYSQIVNPWYLLQKGTMTLPEAAHHILRNLAANTFRSLWPERHIDRRGRLRGNMLALVDLIRNDWRPEKPLEL